MGFRPCLTAGLDLFKENTSSMIPNACQEILPKDSADILKNFFKKIYWKQTVKSPIILFSVRAAVWNLHGKFWEHKIADLCYNYQAVEKRGESPYPVNPNLSP
jgi:hypothetical protein